eukprot:PhM_4_TR3016/c3_g1_i1/m.89353
MFCVEIGSWRPLDATYTRGQMRVVVGLPDQRQVSTSSRSVDSADSDGTATWNEVFEATTTGILTYLNFTVYGNEEGQTGGAEVALASGRTELSMQQLWFRKEVFEPVVMLAESDAAVGKLFVTFTVSPKDTAGYATRLRHFFHVYNPDQLGVIDEIMATAGEREAFQRMWKKYRVVDYAARARRVLEECDPTLASRLHDGGESLITPGQEELSVLQLLRTYGCAEPLVPDAEHRQRELAAHYGIDLEAIGGGFDEREEAISAAIDRSRAPEPNPKAYMFGPTFRVRLRQFCAKYPDAIAADKFESVLEDAETMGTELELLSRLIEQHGPEPSEATMPPKSKLPPIQSRRSSAVNSRHTSRAATPNTLAPRADEAVVTRTSSQKVDDPVAASGSTRSRTSSVAVAGATQKPQVTAEPEFSEVERRPSNAAAVTRTESASVPSMPTAVADALQNSPNPALYVDPTANKSPETKEPSVGSNSSQQQQQLQQQQYDDALNAKRVETPGLDAPVITTGTARPVSSTTSTPLPPPPDQGPFDRRLSSTTKPNDGNPVTAARTMSGVSSSSRVVAQPVPAYPPILHSGKFDRLASASTTNNTQTLSRHGTPPMVLEERASLYSDEPSNEWDRFLYRLQRQGMDFADVRTLSDDGFQDMLSGLGFDGIPRAKIFATWKQQQAKSEADMFIRTEPASATHAVHGEVRDILAAQSGMDSVAVTVLSVEIVIDGSLQRQFTQLLNSREMMASNNNNNKTSNGTKAGGGPTIVKTLVLGSYDGVRAHATHGAPYDKTRKTFSVPDGIQDAVADGTRTSTTTYHALIADVCLGEVIPVASMDRLDVSLLQSNNKNNNQSNASAFHVGATGTYVYSNPAQFSPRYLVSFKIDPTAVACQAHKNRLVEFWCDDDKTMICSQCAVLGNHRGHRVVDLEGAAAEARTRLVDLSASARTFLHDVEQMESSLNDALADLRASTATRDNVIRAADAAKEEIDRQCRQLLSSIDASVNSQTDAIAQTRDNVVALAADVARFSRGLEVAGTSKMSTTILKAVDQSRADSVDGLRLRASSIVPPTYSIPKFVASTSTSPSGDTTDFGHVTFVERQAAGIVRSPRKPMQQQPQQAPAVSYQQPFVQDTSNINRGGMQQQQQPQQQQPRFYDPLPQQQQQYQAPPDPYQSPSRQAYNASPFPQYQQQQPQQQLPQYSNYPQQQQQPQPFEHRALSEIMSGGRTASPRINSNNNNATSASIPSGTQHRLQTYHARRGTGTPRSSTPTQRSDSPPIHHSSGDPEHDERSARAHMAQGWKFFRAGDKGKARDTWMDVFTNYGHTCSGTRARAYVAEAVEKDYGAAALWYEKALSINPQCCMTLFNYGVLLETILGRRQEAYRMYMSAAELGDDAAGRRAELLRKSNRDIVV